MTAADELRAAAEKIRTLAAAVPSDQWGTRPWHVEACSEKDFDDCPCIVAQGEPGQWDSCAVRPTQYVADAETPEHARYIAAMHPGVGAALADWLDAYADHLAASTHPGWQEIVSEHPLAVARAINGGQS